MGKDVVAKDVCAKDFTEDGGGGLGIVSGG